VYIYSASSSLSEALHSLQYVKCNRVEQRVKNVTSEAGKAFFSAGAQQKKETVTMGNP
jgi:hypothetical protein